MVIKLPPLRERREDIIPLAEHFLNKFSERYGKEVYLWKETKEWLVNHDWPGNVRELKNVIERLVVLQTNDIFPEHLPWEIQENSLITQAIKNGIFDRQTFEEQRIKRALALTNYQVKEAQKMLKMPRSTLYRKIKEYGIELTNKNKKEKAKVWYKESHFGTDG